MHGVPDLHFSPLCRWWKHIEQEGTKENTWKWATHLPQSKHRYLFFWRQYVSAYGNKCSYFSRTPSTFTVLFFFQAQNNPKLVDCMMKDLDLNKDDKLDFEEFLPLFVGLSLACEKCYMRTQKKCKKWSTALDVTVHCCCWCVAPACIVLRVNASLDMTLPPSSLVCLINPCWTVKQFKTRRE